MNSDKHRQLPTPQGPHITTGWLGSRNSLYKLICTRKSNTGFQHSNLPEKAIPAGVQPVAAGRSKPGPRQTSLKYHPWAIREFFRDLPQGTFRAQRLCIAVNHAGRDVAISRPSGVTTMSTVNLGIGEANLDEIQIAIYNERIDGT